MCACANALPAAVSSAASVRARFMFTVGGGVFAAAVCRLGLLLQNKPNCCEETILRLPGGKAETQEGILTLFTHTWPAPAEAGPAAGWQVSCLRNRGAAL